MFSFINFARTLLSFSVSVIYTLISVFCTGFTLKELPKAPKDFFPVLRFAVCSDVHLGIDTVDENLRLEKLFDTVYSYADGESYKEVDALCMVGDFTGSGKEEEYEVFNGIVGRKLRDGTQLVICSGNHEYIEYRDYDASIGNKVYSKMLERPVDEHTVIDGYHFISLSYCDDGKTFKAKKKWLRNELDRAVADTGDKPVFVFQHPAPFGTVYGSINWGDLSIAEVLKNYPQVIDFSGHSHYPVNDPRSIWQGAFTALGCGTLSYFETELDYIAGNFPYDTEKAAQFYIVEADAEGNVLIKPYDLITDSFFGVEYYLSDLADKNYPYSFANMKRLDNAPVFSDDTRISVCGDDKGDYILTFTGAKDNFVVESYKVSVARNGILKVCDDNFSGKYMYLFEDDTYTVNMGKLKKGKKYTVEIVALNAYSECSRPFYYSFTA